MLRMLGMLRHRGPDQFGIYSDGRATLGSARLSIVDLSNGQQPIANEDETLWIVLNGEVFNYLELRTELVGRGHRFRTNSDTEVVLHLFEQYGHSCLSRLNGQFAFAIYDSRQCSLFAARDRLGVRPLYYLEHKGTFLFASEIKALLACEGVDAEVDPDALNEVFTYWSPLPGRTMFRGVRELCPGHWLTYANGSLHMDRYWSMRFCSEAETRQIDESRAIEELRELLTDATRIRLKAEVPVAAYLSGGLDSSIIARITTDHVASEVATFSIAFDDAAFDETEHQLRMARALHTRHEVLRASYEDIGQAFIESVWHTEVPITRTAPAPMFLLSRLTRDAGFKVALTGEGADEFFGGYDLFKEAIIRHFWARRPASTLRPRLLQRLYADIPGVRDASPDVLAAFFGWRLTDVASPFYSHMVRWRNTARIRRFFAADLAGAVSKRTEPEAFDLPAEYLDWGPLERAQFLEASLFLPQYLLSSQGDRMAMAHSVETRHPFLDFRVVDWATSLPSRLKMNGLKDKYVLRRFARDLLPPEVWQRPKRPYRAPISRSLFGPTTRDTVHELLSPRRIQATGLFCGSAVSRLVQKVDGAERSSETDDMAIAGILSTQIWHSRFITHFRLLPAVTAADDVKECGPAFQVAAV